MPRTGKRSPPNKTTQNIRQGVRTMGTFFVIHENYFFSYTSQDLKDFKKGFRGGGFFWPFYPPPEPTLPVSRSCVHPHLALLSVFVVCFCCCCCFCSCRSVSFSSFSSRLSSWPSPSRDMKGLPRRPFCEPQSMRNCLPKTYLGISEPQFPIPQS